MSGLVDSLNYSKFDFVDSDDEVRWLKGNIIFEASWVCEVEFGGKF